LKPFEIIDYKFPFYRASGIKEKTKKIVDGTYKASQKA